MDKTIKEIFKDYNSNSFSLNAGKIKTINLFKKSNKLEVVIISNDFIKIEDIYSFEQYLKKRFNIFEVDIKLEYNNKIDIDMLQEWNLIIAYMAHRHPLSKAFLKNSSIEIDDNNITVKMAMKGKNVLQANSFDKIISKIIENVYGLQYKINFVEDISEDSIKLYQEHAKKLEEEAIMHLQVDMPNEEPQKINNEKSNSKAAVGQNNTPEVSVSIEVPQEPQETSPLIYGKSLKLKEQLVKVIDLSVDSGKVQLDGEILNIDTRELKSGKVLVMFDLYDGTSTITCKAFAEGDKSKELVRKIERRERS